MPKKCIELSCLKQACYNYKDKSNGIYCNTHKKDNMIDIINKKCKENNCIITATFNYENEMGGLYCSKHKKDNMINIKSKKCKELNCKIRPTFNYEGMKTALYCAKHKKENMINVKDKKCREINCNIIPHYNFEDEINAIYCNLHKKDNMINIKSKKCKELHCKIRPTFNYEGMKIALYCAKHKKENMVDVKNKICIESRCFKHPNYNYDNNIIPLYCNIHKKLGMINIITPKCKTPFCQIISNTKYEGYCLNCFIHLFPDKPNTRNYKTKEKATTDYILEQFPDFTWIVDKMIQDGCSRKRPDLLLDLGYQVIIVEVDENQHESYDCSCENKRLMLLSQDVGHRPIVFIRFNPDEYNAKNEKVTSCWTVNKLGICTVKKTKEKEWSQRLEALKNQVEYWMNPENKLEKTIEIIQLFYDYN
jgi:hypothetical protein